MSDVSHDTGEELGGDERSYPPPTSEPLGQDPSQMPLGSDELSTTAEPRLGAGIRKGGGILVAVLLVASSLRVIAAVIAAILGWKAVPYQTSGRQLGAALVWAGGFADAEGILLLLVVLGLVWWKASDSDAGWGSKSGLTLWWTAALFGLSVLGAAASTVGEIMIYAGYGTKSYIWQHYVGTGVFDAVYCVVAFGGLYESIRLLTARPRVPKDVATS